MEDQKVFTLRMSTRSFAVASYAMSTAVIAALRDLGLSDAGMGAVLRNAENACEIQRHPRHREDALRLVRSAFGVFASADKAAQQ